MRILYLNHYAGSSEMGMEFRPYYLSREWVRMGHEVTIVAGDYSHLRRINPVVTRDFQKQIIDGITYYWVKTGEYEGNGAARAVSMFRFVGKLMTHASELVERYRPDVVIASSTYPLDTYAAQKIRRLSGAKYVHEVHDMWPSTLYEIGGMSQCHPFVQMMQMAENSTYRHCDALVSLPPLAKGYMVEHGLAPEQFTAVQNGVVLEDWERPEPLLEEHERVLDELSDKFVVGYAGGHALSNALDVLLDVAAHMQDEDIAFVLVGKGVEKARLMARASAEGLGNIHFLPPVDKLVVPTLLERFDCCFMSAKDSPLYRFGLSANKIFDYMMAGKPIVLAINAPATQVSEYQCGVEVPYPPVTNVVEAIRTIRNLAPAQRDEIGSRGKQAVLERYTYEKLAKQFMDAMEAA